MNNLVIPPSPNWYESRILACALDNTLIYGSRSEIVVIKPQTYDKPADIKVIPHAHYERITSIDVNPSWRYNNMWAVSAGEDKIIKLWNMQNYTCKYNNNVHTTVADKLTGAIFAGNDKVVSVSENGLISVWRTATNEVTPMKNLFVFRVQVTALSSCPHSPWLVAFGLKCGLIVIADLRKTGRVLFRVRGHERSIISLSWCPTPFNVFPKYSVKKKKENTKDKTASKTKSQEGGDKKDKLIKVNGDITKKLEKDNTNKAGETSKTDVIKSDEIANVPNNVILNEVKMKQDIIIEDDESEIISTTRLVEKLLNDILQSQESDDEDVQENSKYSSYNSTKVVIDDINKSETNQESQSKVNTGNEDENIIEAASSSTATYNVKICDDNTKENENLIGLGDLQSDDEISDDQISVEEEIDSKVNTEIENPMNKETVDENVETCILEAFNEDDSKENGELQKDDVKIKVEKLRKSDSDNKLKQTTEPQSSKSEVVNDREMMKPVKEYLLASSSKGGAICIWRAGTDGRKQIELYLTSNKKRRNRINEKTWITLCWIAPHILLSSSAAGELLKWDLLKLNKDTNEPQKILVHHDHSSRNLFAIAAPIRLVWNWEDTNWRNKKELNAWTVGQERLLLCASIQADRTVFSAYPTNGSAVHCLASSPLDPTRLAVGIGDNTPKIWDLSRPHIQCIAMGNLWLKYQNKILTLAWHPTMETILAYGTLEGRVGFIHTNNVSNSSFLLTQYFRTAVYSLSWGPLNGNVNLMGLYACGEGQVAIYSVNGPAEDPEIMAIDNEYFTCVCWKPDHALFTIGSRTGSILIYNLKLEHMTTIYSQYKTIQRVLWHPEATAEDNETSPYISWLAVSTASAAVVVYDLSKENKVDDGDKNVDERIVAVLNGHSKPVRCLCWSSYEGAKLVSGGDDGVIQVWNVKTQSIISTFTGHNLEAILTVLWSPMDKDFVITGAKDNCIRIWNVTEHSPMSEEDLTQIRKGRSKLKQEIKKHKHVEETDEEDTVKVKRNVILNLTSKVQNNSIAVLEDCKRIFSLPDVAVQGADEKSREAINRKIDATMLFGERDTIFELLEIEQRKHVEKKKFVSSQHISLWKGDFAETLKEAIKDGTVTPWLISLAPMISPKLWQEACLVYAKKLTENPKSDPLEVVSYLLACHQVDQAIEVLCNATLYREALVLAKCRLSKDDPVINDILLKWATFCIVNGACEIAAQCYIVLGKYEEAAKALYKRSDLETLEFALQLAEKTDNQDLKDAIMLRYNIFKSCGNKIDVNSSKSNDQEEIHVNNDESREESHVIDVQDPIKTDSIETETVIQ